jgi:hypothetical protein
LLLEDFSLNLKINGAAKKKYKKNPPAALLLMETYPILPLSACPKW